VSPCLGGGCSKKGAQQARDFNASLLPLFAGC